MPRIGFHVSSPRLEFPVPSKIRDRSWWNMDKWTQETFDHTSGFVCWKDMPGDPMECKSKRSHLMVGAQNATAPNNASFVFFSSSRDREKKYQRCVVNYDGF
jgi:hypothetical protein